MHLSDGEIKTFLDAELNVKRQEQVSAHLESCQRCQERAETLQRRATQVSQQMNALAAQPVENPMSPSAARARLQERITTKEKNPMLEKIFSRQYRLAWIGFALVVILGVAMAFPSVRAIANGFLGLFRVQRVSVIQINPGDLPEQLGSSSQFEYMLSENVNVEEIGELQEVADAAEASQLAGIPVRLPTNVEGEGQLAVQPGTSVSFEIDLPLVKALLDELGQSQVDLPANLDGETVTMQLPPSVVARYGECEIPKEVMREAGTDPDQPLPRMPECVSFVQVASPTISAPPGLDIAAIGEAFLQVMGMTPEEAQQFSRTVDWSTTLIVPIPRYGTAYQGVMVDGVEGTLIEQGLEEHFPQYLLIWVKDEVVYALTGQGDQGEALSIANSLK